MSTSPDALVLFSGGLDSLLAARLLQNQGLNVLCLHFYSPFFGKPQKVPHWHTVYGLDIRAIDASEPFAAILLNPPHGTGKNLNPCIDCKILLLSLARKLLPEYGAKFIATGEVLGQRPMSQRTEALNIIKKESGTSEILLRPLSARHLPPTPMEESGLVDRNKLLAISGRGRNEQLSLAKAMGISEIPAPGGGCKLTERENSRRYWAILQAHREQDSSTSDLVPDLWLANLGRLLFHRNSAQWLAIGRNRADNEKLAQAANKTDLLLRLPFPGPLALLRQGRLWNETTVKSAAALLASYSPEAVKAAKPLSVRSGEGSFTVLPERQEGIWALPDFEEVRASVRIAEQSRHASHSYKSQSENSNTAPGRD